MPHGHWRICTIVSNQLSGISQRILGLITILSGQMKCREAEAITQPDREEGDEEVLDLLGKIHFAWFH